VLPLSGQLASLVDFGCALVMYFVLATWYGITPHLPMLSVPLWVLLAGMNALGIGLVLAAVNVRYRDVSQVVPFMAQVWMFATPVAYPLSAIPDRWQSLYLLNPMVGVIEGMRWALLPEYRLDVMLLVPGLVIGLALLVIGLAWFQRAQRRFADIV
jgi:lipopolysaccharide transport system permease protein